MLLLFAWKNIWRNKVRSIIILTAIAIGLFGGLFSSAFLNGMVEQRIQKAIANETSNIQIHAPQYFLNKELKDTITNSKSIGATLDTMIEVMSYTTRIKITAMASTASAGTGITINGIDPDREKTVTDIYKNIGDSNGSWFTDKRANSAVIGSKLAEKLKIKLKSKIIITFQTSQQNITSTAFKVTGIYETSNSMFDERNVFVRISDIAPMINFSEHSIHEIAISVDNDSKTERLRSKLQILFPKTDIQTWKEIMPDLGMMSDMMSQTLYILLTIILLALCFGIINTMMMAVLERTREIGMLMALGLKQNQIFRLIVIETVLLSFTGAIVGMFFSFLTISYFSIHGIHLHSFAEGISALGYNSIIYPTLSLHFYLVLSLLVFITGIVSSLFPAQRALKLNPVDAIRMS